MIIGALKTIKKIPQRLIYSAPDLSKHNMFSTQNGKVLGFMQTTPVELKTKDFYPINAPVKSLYINKIEAFVKNNKVGSDFINFAKNLSKKEGAQGRLHVIAYNADDLTKPPQIFYRKLGFACSKQKETEIIDDAIRYNIPLPIHMRYGSCMYLEKF